MTRKELLELSVSLGHADMKLFESRGGRYQVACLCGYRSSVRPTKRAAKLAGLKHALRMAEESLGVSLLENVAGVEYKSSAG